MAVSFWETKEYDEIDAVFGPRRDIVPFEKIYDDSPECQGQDGVDGFTITVDRVFYKDGAEVRREPITTRYKPAPDVTCGKDPKDDKPKGDKPKDDKPKDGEPSPSAEPSAPEGDAPPPEDDVFTNQ